MSAEFISTMLLTMAREDALAKQVFPINDAAGLRRRVVAFVEYADKHKDKYGNYFNTLPESVALFVNDCIAAENDMAACVKGTSEFKQAREKRNRVMLPGEEAFIFPIKREDVLTERAKRAPPEFPSVEVDTDDDIPAIPYKDTDRANVLREIIMRMPIKEGDAFSLEFKAETGKAATKKDIAARKKEIYAVYIGMRRINLISEGQYKRLMRGKPITGESDE